MDAGARALSLARQTDTEGTCFTSIWIRVQRQGAEQTRYE